jgi:hypothetical protein
MVRVPGERARGAAVFVAVVAFVVYLLTAYRTLPGGDSGELIGAVASGGVIHPPGYPLYSILGGLFLHLPIGSAAFRLNVLSAACDALAAAFLARSVTRATASLAGGVAAAAMFGFAPGVWRYAIAAEVFALNNLAVAVLVWLAVGFAETRERRYAYGGALVLGLGLANHQTVVFTGVPIVLWALATGPELRRPRVLAQLVLASLAGLLPYLYLPVLASHHAFVSWGAADTWAGFWTHVFRSEYGTFQLAPAGVGANVHAEEVLGAFSEHAWAQLGPWGLLLALLGAVVTARDGWRHPRRLGLVAFAPPVVAVGVMMAGGNLPIASELFREILARFWQQPDLYLCAFAGVGVAAIDAGVSRIHASAAAHAVAPVVAGALACAQVARSYSPLDHHDDRAVEQYGAEMLRAAPDGAILVTKGDLVTNSIRYLIATTHVRPDVRVVDQELLATAWGVGLFAGNAPRVVFPGPRLSLDPLHGFQLKQLFDANRAAPVQVCGGMAPGDLTANATYGLWPMGLCDEVRAGSEPVSIDDWLTRSDAALPRIDFTGSRRAPGSWEAVVWSDYWEVRQSRGAHLLTVIGANPSRFKYLPAAVDILQRVVDENPDVGPHVYKNLAVAIGRVGITTTEQKQAALRAWEGYLKKAPSGDPQLPAIRKEVERLRQ